MGPEPAAPAQPSPDTAPRAAGIESGYAWFRLLIAMLMSTIGGVGMWSVIVAIPTLQAEFGVDRAGASLPYTMTMVGFAIGGIVMGRASDRFGVVVSQNNLAALAFELGLPRAFLEQLRGLDGDRRLVEEAAQQSKLLLLEGHRSAGAAGEQDQPDAPA